ncbi:cell division protein FtsN [Aliidiomarina halalkaliphila]|uniref:Cell division protein FtsN n=1 Tax=Aliidiomarina halalkaliphila TaxID=2593535 RepID=A0A552X0C0_9GAMM|nr:SPOR domain-containing protein [Aliidiomarina halalkaliphila]TRW48319.1 cell division protein FtsN [Aliidiomarina halalkaliphila]
MPVDYAKKGAPKKRKPAAKSRNSGGRSGGAVRNRKGNGPQKPPIKQVVITLLVVLAFGVGLWMLKNGEPEVVVSAQDSPNAAPERELDPLPEKPEERWQYIRELENRTVEVDVPERQESRPRLMQCGSFRNFNDADTLRANIAMQGFESQVRESHGSNGRWFRVILGPFENLRAAQRVNNQLQRGGIYGCQIWLWNLD